MGILIFENALIAECAKWRFRPISHRTLLNLAGHLSDDYDWSSGPTIMAFMVVLESFNENVTFSKSCVDRRTFLTWLHAKRFTWVGKEPLA
jgi:hypothetical protein